MTSLIASLIRTLHASPRQSRACGKSATGTCGTRRTASAVRSMSGRASSSRAQPRASVIKTSWALMNCASPSSSTTAWSLCMHVCSPRRLASPHRCEGELVNDRVCYQQVGNPSRMVWFLQHASAHHDAPHPLPHRWATRPEWSGSSSMQALTTTPPSTSPQVGNPSRMVWFLTPYWYVGKRDEKALGQGWVQVRTPRSSARATPLSMQVLTTAPFPHCPTGALARSSARAHQWRLVGVELGRAKMGRGARPAHCT